MLWTDTARQDWEALERSRRTEWEPLLDRIETSPGEDHVLSSGEFELRYQKQESLFVFFRRDTAGVTVLYFCEMQAQAAPGETQVRVLDMQTREIPNGMEAEGTYAFTREDGSTQLRRQYVRKVDMGDTYNAFFHMASTGQPTYTAITSGKKGRIEGDFRFDEIEMIMLRPDGSIDRKAAQRVPIWIKDPMEGLSEEDRRAKLQEFIKKLPRGGVSGDELAEHMRKWRQMG